MLIGQIHNSRKELTETVSTNRQITWAINHKNRDLPLLFSKFLTWTSLKEGKNFEVINCDEDEWEFLCISASKYAKDLIEERMEEYIHAFSDQINKERSIKVNSKTAEYLWRHPENLYKKEWEGFLLDIKIDCDVCALNFLFYSLICLHSIESMHFYPWFVYSRAFEV